LMQDLKILARLPPYLSAVPTQDMQFVVNAFKGAQSREAQNQLTEHYDLERKLESAAQEISADEESEHHLSVRALVDTLRSAQFHKYKGVYPASDAIDRFTNMVSVLRFLLADRFNTTVEDDVIKFAILNDTVNREKTASADVQALNREHANEKQSRKVEVSKKDKEITKLRDENHDIEERATADQQASERAATDHRLSEKQRFEREFADLEAEVNRLDLQLKNVEDTCLGQEIQSRQLRTKKEAALHQVISHYDHEMTTSTTTVKALQTEIDQDGGQLRSVEQELSAFAKDAERVRLEELVEDRRKSHKYEVESRHQDCARIIQAYFRAHAMRQSLLKKGKKKGKKK